MTDVSPYHAASSRELAAAEAFQAEQRIKQSWGRVKNEWIKLAAMLYDFNLNERWKDLGEESYPSFQSWLAQPELGIKANWAYKLIQIYAAWVVEFNQPLERLQTMNPSALQQVASAVQRGRVTVEEALNDAEALGREDLRMKYTTIRQVGDHLEATEEPAGFRCSACGSWVKT